MIHAVCSLCRGVCVCVCVCLIQSLVPLLKWRLDKPASCLLMISINLGFPADSPPSGTKQNSPNLLTGTS